MSQALTREGPEPLELAGHRVSGLSIGGVETCIHLPSLRLAFDVGRCPPEVVAREHLLFTHAHMDHLGGVAYHCASRALRRLAPPTYVVPAVDREAFEALFQAWRGLDRSDLVHRTVPLSPGEEWTHPNGLVVRPFRSPHRAPCQGYALVQRREKLLPELVGRPGSEIRDRRAAGERVTHTVESVEVAFTGDTLVEVVEREELVRSARLLILECTFVDDRVSVEDCRAKGHVHLDEIVERAELFRNEAILLTHFSSRYRARDVRAALDARLPPGLRERVTPFLAGFA